MARSQRLSIRVAKDRRTVCLEEGADKIVLNRKQVLRVIQKALCEGVITDDKSLTLIAESCM